MAADPPEKEQGHEQDQDETPEDEDAAQYSPAGERLRKLQSETEIYRLPPPHDGGSVVRPGDQYLWYAFEAELPIEQQTLLQAAADLLAISREDLSKSVKFLESQFRNLVKEHRKKERRERMDIDGI
jgi:RNA polymerase I-specific transcription initiation factor RRN7